SGSPARTRPDSRSDLPRSDLPRSDLPRSDLRGQTCRGQTCRGQTCRGLTWWGLAYPSAPSKVSVSVPGAEPGVNSTRFAPSPYGAPFGFCFVASGIETLTG